MNRAELKARARAQLGGGIFEENWLLALVVELIAGAILGAASFTVVGAIVLTGPLVYGLAHLYIKQARDGQEMDIGELFCGFSDDIGGNILLGFMEGLFVFLWSLLFFIPGIVKAYSYSMAFYIKSDNPTYTWKQCLDASRAMMKGHKGELFVLDLSFIGWIIVGSLCFGVGTLWVSVYMSAARAQFYNELVKNPV